MFREMSTMVFGGADDIWGEEGKMEVGTRLQARSSMSDDFRTGKITEVHDYGACELSFRPPPAASPSASRGAADDRFCQA